MIILKLSAPQSIAEGGAMERMESINFIMRADVKEMNNVVI